MKGHHYEPIDQYLKDRYLEYIEQGYTKQEAAQMLNQTSTRFRAIRNPNSIHYDEEFTERFQELTQPGGEHETSLVDRLESAAIQRALEKSDPLLKLALIAYSDRYRIFRPQALNQTINIEELKVMLPGVSNETLDRMIAEATEARQLPPAHPDIEAA